jgi:hypothetical protein
VGLGGVAAVIRSVLVRRKSEKRCHPQQKKVRLLTTSFDIGSSPMLDVRFQIESLNSFIKSFGRLKGAGFPLSLFPKSS